MGLEPTTSAVTGRRSNQLSHRAKTNLKLIFDQGIVPSKPNLMTTYNDFFPILYSVGESVRILLKKALDVLRFCFLEP